LKPKNLEGVAAVLQPTQVKEDASSQVSSNMYPTMNVDTVVVLFAIATIFGLVGVVVIDSILTTPEAEAKGCINPNAPGGGSIAFNASKGRCNNP
jgi:hypothetical protein